MIAGFRPRPGVSAGSTNRRWTQPRSRRDVSVPTFRRALWRGSYFLRVAIQVWRESEQGEHLIMDRFPAHQASPRSEIGLDANEIDLMKQPHQGPGGRAACGHAIGAGYGLLAC